MIDVKVPRMDRDKIPLLVCGDEILWVIGFTTHDKIQNRVTNKQISALTLWK